MSLGQEIMLSDGGLEFENKEMVNVCAMDGINHKITTFYNPLENVVERVYGTIKLVIRALCKEQPIDGHCCSSTQTSE